jgi:hypothetical protein
MNLPVMSAARRRALRFLGVAAVAMSLGLTAAVPADAATGFWAGFESGTTNVFSRDQNVDVAAGCAKAGDLGAEAVSTPLSPAFLNLSPSDVDQGNRYGHVRAWVKIDDMADGQNVSVLTIKNANGFNHFDLWRDPTTGHWRWDLFRGDFALSTMAAEVGVWYRIDVLVDFGGDGGSTYTAQVRINGVDQPAIASTSQIGTSVRSFWLGGPVLGYSNTRCYDSVTAEVGDSAFSFTS